MKHFAAILVLASCGAVQAPNPPSTPPPGDPPPTDPPPSARCDTTASFAAPTGRDFATSNTGGATIAMGLSADELEAVIGQGGQLIGARRAPNQPDFDPVDTAAFDELNSASNNQIPSFTGDALHVYYTADGLLAHGARGARNAAFGGAAQVLVDGAPLAPVSFTIARDGQTLYWTDPDDALLRAASAVDAVTFENTTVISAEPIERIVIDASETVLYHGTGGDLLVSTRAGIDQPFGSGRPLAELATDGFEAPLAVSGDNCVLYFQSDRAGHLGAADVWKTARPR